MLVMVGSYIRIHLVGWLHLDCGHCWTCHTCGWTDAHDLTSSPWLLRPALLLLLLGLLRLTARYVTYRHCCCGVMMPVFETVEVSVLETYAYILLRNEVSFEFCQ